MPHYTKFVVVDDVHAEVSRRIRRRVDASASCRIATSSGCSRVCGCPTRSCCRQPPRDPLPKAGVSLRRIRRLTPACMPRRYAAPRRRAPHRLRRRPTSTSASMKGVVLGHLSRRDARRHHARHRRRRTSFAGALELAAAYPLLPAGTVFLVVVDPGVGSCAPGRGRGIRRLSVRGARQRRVDASLRRARRRARGSCSRVSDTARAVVSRTFEGRDRFAPAAAWLAKGVPTRGARASHRRDPQLRVPCHVQTIRDTGIDGAVFASIVSAT